MTASFYMGESLPCTTLDTQSEPSVKVSEVKQTFRNVSECPRIFRERSGDITEEK
jgi:hypothetical protein